MIKKPEVMVKAYMLGVDHSIDSPTIKKVIILMAKVTKRKARKNKLPEQSNIATSSTESLGELYLVCDNEEPDICVNSVSSACHFEEWLLDSGCTFHMTPNINMFCSYTNVNSGNVVMGNNVACKVIGIGNIRVKFDTGFVYLLENVRHIPELSKNLISIGTLEDSKFVGKFGDGCFKISKGALLAIK
ncbi:Integrase catalytic domain-containing protein [Abeliophyllum distichum]|uniref:Integrase catalytic domain-containing protein n=1 Tax=Abeliophyllum distichum TaxID=126358 RepID=A0ABD1UP03_9LAMI